MQTTPLIGMPTAALNEAKVPGAWRTLGWFGLMLAFVGLTDVALVFYPARFGDPTWEFGVLANAVSTLPLLSVGFAAVLSSALAQEKRVQARVAAAVALLIGVSIVCALIVYLTTVPIALKLAPAEVMPGIYKSIFRTSVMAMAFSVTFIAGGVVAIRSTRVPR